MVQKLSTKISLAFALIGVIAGVSGFVAFVFAFYNFHAGNKIKDFDVILLQNLQNRLFLMKIWPKIGIKWT